MSGLFPEGFDGPRELPNGLRPRLVAEVSDAALSETDGPRPVPPGLHDRLEAVMLTPGRSLPARLRRRADRTLTGRRPALVLAASIVLLILGTLALPIVAERTARDADTVAQPGPRAQHDPSGPDALDTLDALDGGTAASGESDGGPTANDTPNADADATPPSAALGPGGSGAGIGSRTFGSHAAPPPFAYGDPGFNNVSNSAAMMGQSAGGEPGPPPPPPPPPLRIGIAGTDDGTPAEAAFRAYVRLVNEAGGVRDRRIELHPTSAADPAADVMAVVNLGRQVLAEENGPPSWVEGPLLETLTVPEDQLRGRVFSFGSALERQARLAASSAFPDEVGPTTVAVVYRSEASGPYRTRVPAALTEALEARGVIVVVADVDPDDPDFVPAHAAFVSMPSEDAGAFLESASEADYAPPDGTWGVASLFDESIADRFTETTLALSPYAPASNEEMEELREGSGGPVSADAVHGWVAAKALAVAVYESEPDSPSATSDALAELEGWQTSFIPPYEVRPETRARTPEAIVLEAADGRFRSVGDFLRDTT